MATSFTSLKSQLRGDVWLIFYKFAESFNSFVRDGPYEYSLEDIYSYHEEFNKQRDITESESSDEEEEDK